MKTFLKIKLKLKKLSIQPNKCKKVFAISPGAGDSKRFWGAENYKNLITKILNEYEDSIVIILGGKDDIALGKKIKENRKSIIDTTGKTNLLEIYALLKNVDIFIGNDSGTLHFASATKTPIVEISCHPKNCVRNHLNSSLRFVPYNVPHKILQLEPDEVCKNSCNEITSRFINKIIVDKVFNAVKNLEKEIK